MAEIVLKNTDNVFAKRVYEYCGEDIGDLLTLLCVEVSSEKHSMNAVFFSTRVIEQRELSVIEHAVTRAAGGLDITCEVHFDIVHPFDVKDGVMLYMRKERPIYALALSAAQWRVEEAAVRINAQSGKRLDKKEVESYIRSCIKRIFSVDFRVEMTAQQDAGPVTQEEYERTREELSRSIILKNASGSVQEPDEALVPPPGDEYAPQDGEPARDALGADANTQEKHGKQIYNSENKKAVDQKGSREQDNSSRRQRMNPDRIYGPDIKDKQTPINELNEFSGRVCIEGEVLAVESKALRNGEKTILTVDITDYTGSVRCKLFVKNELVEEICENVRQGVRIMVGGDYTIDSFAREHVVMVRSIAKSSVRIIEEDTAPVKRVELHLHTRLSEMDSVVNPSELVKLLKAYGHDCVAITDHGVVQAYPDMEAAIAKQKLNIKLLFGLEGYLFDDKVPMLSIDDTPLSEPEYVVFDLETTGLDSQSDRIIEIAAVKVKDGEVVGRFSTFVDPERNISDKIVRLTGITNSMVAGAPDQKTAVSSFLDFARGSILVAHNAAFDTSFIRYACNKFGFEYGFAALDTLALSRLLYPELKAHKLDKVCEHLHVLLDGHHRAINDAEATAGIMLKMFAELEKRGITTSEQLNTAAGSIATGETYHIIIFAKNKQGLFNLYKLVSESHLNYFKRRPRIPRSLLNKLRDGLILGSACEAGELYRAIVNRESDEHIRRIAEFYDFLEVQPIGNNAFMIREGKVSGEKELQDFNKYIIELGERMGKPVVATGDVHFLRKRDECFRRIIMAGQGFEDADNQPPLYYRTTQEMLDEFSYLPPEKAREIVIENTRKIADMCTPMESFPRDRLYTPKMEGAEEEIRAMAMEKAHRIYGDVLPEIVEKRLDKELTAIIKHGFAVLYLIAHKVVNKSLSDGYLVGSRGSVGSSFAATMTDITEVNPLPPHYVCPNCRYSDFNVDTEKYGCGFDLPRIPCPKCGTEMDRQGFDIPFEVFMGFNGDKAPDIDLNFSGVYQPVIHKYIEELFGHDNVFRAGTIAGVADKTAIGYVLKYCQERGITVSNAEKQRLASGIIDVKRTTGQHPAGMVVLPKEYQIYEFTPIQYPSNDATKGVITTHFDFNSLHDTLLKLDILGHDDPTTIKMLEKLTGIDARSIPLDDPAVMSLFLSTEALGVSAQELGTPVGTFGIPEFGTKFVRKMLVETKPVSFADLVRISGLSHGTDVWTNNAQVLVDTGVAKLPELICTREDIMNKLIHKGAPESIAFKTMETVRKGRKMTEEMEQAMVDVDMPQWFIDSCHKIKYMFPKAHAAAYVTMALRIAYFKVHYPQAYYIAYFTVRADDFDISLMQGGVESIRAQIEELYAKTDLNAREKGILTMLELALEMKLRGLDFSNIDIYKSAATDFLPEGENIIRPPLNAIAGLGDAAAQSIVEARKDGEFSSQNDLLARTKLSKSLLDTMANYGCLRGLPESEQYVLFQLD